MRGAKRIKQLWIDRFGKPGWLSFPEVMAIDTSNFCGPKYCGLLCSYCYPQWKIQQGKRSYKTMPMEWIQWIIKQIQRYGQNMLFVSYFLNGDGLTEPRLHEILALSKRYVPKLRTQTFTCGVLTKNVDNLLDPNLDLICFTISAHNPELYSIVHRGNHFYDALKTLEVVLDRKKPHQRVEVHLVLTKDNFPYVKEWWEFFGKYLDVERIISPLVASYDNLPSQKALGNLTVDDQEKAVLDVASEKGRMWIRNLLPDGRPCVLWNNMSIDVEGYVLQCCNWSPPQDVNYGLVPNLIEEGRTLREVWLERLANRMRNRLCRSCNMKHPDWKRRLLNLRLKTELKA